MSALENWLEILGIFALLGGGVFLLRRHVRKGLADISRRLDRCDYVVMEAVPEQLEMLKSDFGADGWCLAESKPSADGAFLYTFRKVDRLALPLSKVLGLGERKSSCRQESAAHFQMKIKEYGPVDGQHA